MLPSLPRVYPLVGFCSGYVIVMLFNPVRQVFGDLLFETAQQKRAQFSRKAPAGNAVGRLRILLDARFVGLLEKFL